MDTDSASRKRVLGLMIAYYVVLVVLMLLCIWFNIQLTARLQSYPALAVCTLAAAAMLGAIFGIFQSLQKIKRLPKSSSTE